MDDENIIELYFSRDERAIAETQTKYGEFCHTVAYNILRNREDSEECVNDTYLRLWKLIPPNRPLPLRPYVGRITRNVALDKYDYNNAEKRRSNLDLIYDELSNMIPSEDEPCEEDILIRDLINSFLEGLSPHTRIIFVRRYWYMCEIKDISRGLGISEGSVKSTLHRTRKKLKELLKKEGITL